LHWEKQCVELIIALSAAMEVARYQVKCTTPQNVSTTANVETPNKPQNKFTKSSDANTSWRG